MTKTRRRMGDPGLAGLLVCLLFVFHAATSFAQPRRDARLLITVVDQSNGVLPGATVTVVGIDDATKEAPIGPVQSASNGLATISDLAPGRYTIEAAFDGFDTGTLKDVRVRAGDNRHVMVLLLQRVKESVTVEQDRQTSAADRKSGVFGTALTREQMDALSDDPNEMQRQLQDMAGPGAVIRIDSFEGGALPPKSQIKAIHITRDQFAAENHGADGTFIDIITQPGLGPIRTNMNYSGHSSAMTARNAFAPTKGDDQVQNFGLNLSGALVKNRVSFNLGVNGFTTFDSPIITIASPDGTLSNTTTVRAPRDQRFLRGSLDYAVTPDQTLRMSYNQSDFTNQNVGIGQFNELERGYTNENHAHTFRVQEAGPIGRRFFTNTRINVGWTDTSSLANTEAVTVRVIDAFTAGGAQVAGGRHSRDLNIASDLDYVRGIHSVRGGLAIDGNWFQSDDTSNYLGTYTFENLDAYLAGRPRSFVRRAGDPTISFNNFQTSVYVQDDIRVRRSLTLTGGLRYEVQTHLDDRSNLGPRVGITWAPLKSGKATLRASWGRFFDWFSTNTYEQTLRVDGFRQQELQVLNPTYPGLPLENTGLTAVNRYVLDSSLEHPHTNRASAGLDYGFTQRLHGIVTYRYTDNVGLLRGENLNAPIDGVRPDARFGNVIQVLSDGQGRQHQLQVSAQTPPPPPGPGGGPLWDWKRWGFFSNYQFLINENNTDGPFSTPASGSLADDWGPAQGSARHRLIAGFTGAGLRNLTWQIDGQWSSGTPFTVTTGFDDNGDLIFNDRPFGVGRNTERTTGQFSMNLFASYGLTFGPRVVLPGGPMIYGTPAGVNVTTFVPPPSGRYRISFNVNIQNLTNHTNYIGYSGVVTSPYYLSPTGAINPRRVNVGLQFGF